jgi:hypothetical protein
MRALPTIDSCLANSSQSRATSQCFPVSSFGALRAAMTRIPVEFDMTAMTTQELSKSQAIRARFAAIINMWLRPVAFTHLATSMKSMMVPPIVAAPAQLLEWLQKAYTLSESLKPESDKPKGKGKADPGFRKLFDAVGYRPLVNRINTLEDTCLYVSGLNRGKTVPCPMPHHKHKDYSNCFGPVKNAPELLKCLGNCQWTGDMVAAVYELDGGGAYYKSMYDAARAICREENLNFDEFFPPKVNPDNQGRDASPSARSEESKSNPAELPQHVEVNQCESELKIAEEPLPEFPRFTGSLADMSEAIAPDLPYSLKFISAATIVGSLLAGKAYIAGSTHIDPRFYTVMIDTKGAGKGGSYNEVRSALYPLILGELNIVPSIDSGPALVLELAEHPRTMLYADELDKVFEIAKPTGSSRNSLFAELLTLWRAERNWRTAIGGWRGGCSGSKGCP